MIGTVFLVGLALAFAAASAWAISNYLGNVQGTGIVWKSSGGDYAITLTSVTTGNGRQGAKGDLQKNSTDGRRSRIWDVLFTSSVGSAPTAGNEIELWWAASDSATAGTDNPGGTSGTDATFNTTPDEYKQQLIFVGSLVLSNNGGTGIQKQWLSFVPPTRYGMPVVVNKSGQTLGSTAGDHTITLFPREEAVSAAV